MQRTDADPFATERERFAVKIDGELRLACRSEATMRRELGDASRALLESRVHHAFDFVRFSDYARERLGVSGHTIQEAALMARRLDALPAIGRAFDRSEISWAQARSICRVAVPADAERWVAVARQSTVAALDRLVAQARRPDGVPQGLADDPNEIDGEPAVRWRLASPARVRGLWRHATELASRVSGEPLAEWRAAEVIAAEASSGRPVGAAMGDRALVEGIRQAHRARRKVRAAQIAEASTDVAVPESSPDAAPPIDSSASTAFHENAAPASSTAARDAEAFSLEPPASSDPIALEARVREALRVLATIDPTIGRLLQVVIAQRIHRFFKYPRFAAYVRERLGISAGKAWALVKVEKATQRSTEFADAYYGGDLSWVRTVTLLPVLERMHGPAWVARSQAVTVRRLNDEVAWVLAKRDAEGPDVPLAPPPLDDPLLSPFAAVTAECSDPAPVPRVQIGAHDTGAAFDAESEQCRDSSPAVRVQIGAHADNAALEICDGEIRFTGPASVVALLRDVLDAFGDPYEPRWRALERVLRHVIRYWETLPRHPDPVFARDGWRCTVPACSSRRNLHDHHITFRSRGGDNARDNRTTVCAAHHLHGIHTGTIRAEGRAPHAIEWQLGVRPGKPPLLRFIGDRYAPPEPDGD